MGVPAHYPNLSPTQKIQHKISPAQFPKSYHKKLFQQIITKKLSQNFPKSYNHSLIIKSLFYIVRNNMKNNMKKYTAKNTLIFIYLHYIIFSRYQHHFVFYWTLVPAHFLNLSPTQNLILEFQI